MGLAVKCVPISTHCHYHQTLNMLHVFFLRDQTAEGLRVHYYLKKLLEVKLDPRQILRSLDDLGLLSTKSNCVRPRMFTVYSVENSRVI